MREVTAETAADYLRDAGRVTQRQAVDVRPLGWGVSNVVLWVEVEGEQPFVLKQSRERLRTRALWVSRLDRIWTECAALELLASLLPAGTVPEVLFADRENYLFAMTCAPEGSVVWKERLLAGAAEPAIARRAGEVLGTMHAQSVGHPALAGRLAETLVFDQLRIDPFYRTIARVHPDLADRLEALTNSMSGLPPSGRCFVHADFSPKNILVHDHGLTLVDFETAHAGDPAYDLGFFLSHLLLKAVRSAPDEDAYLALTEAFWESYLTRNGDEMYGDLVHRSCSHAAACALARVDGTSPVDYLDESAREIVRRFARAALRCSAKLDWARLLGLLAREMHSHP